MTTTLTIPAPLAQRFAAVAEDTTLSPDALIIQAIADLCDLAEHHKRLAEGREAIRKAEKAEGDG